MTPQGDRDGRLGKTRPPTLPLPHSGIYMDRSTYHRYKNAWQSGGEYAGQCITGRNPDSRQLFCDEMRKWLGSDEVKLKMPQDLGPPIVAEADREASASYTADCYINGDSRKEWVQGLVHGWSNKIKDL